MRADFDCSRSLDGEMKTRLTVRNCPIEFRFKCSKLWDELGTTDRPEVRHCDSCDHDVFFCSTDEETIAHAKAGHCIARETPVRDEQTTVVLGFAAEMPKLTPQQEEAACWSAREGGINDSIRNAARSTRACPECSYPAPDWRVTCRVCGFAMGRVRNG